MPKRFPRLKPDTAAQSRRTARQAGGTKSVASLLQRPGVMLGRIQEQARSQQDWHRWLQDHLPDKLGTHVTGAVEQPEKLVVFAESAAWSGRIRFALAELEAELEAARGPGGKVEVRVLPKGAERR